MTGENWAVLLMISMTVIGSTYAVCVLLHDIRWHLSRIEAVQWELLRHHVPDSSMIKLRRIGE